jgi:GAF domain-containing protein
MSDKPTSTVEQYRASIKALEDKIEQMDELVARILSGMKGQGGFGLDDLSRLILQIRTQYLVAVQRESRHMTEEILRMEELMRIGALVTTSLELDKVLEDVMDTVIGLTGAERAYLMLIHPETGDLETHAARNWDKETVLAADVSFSSSVVSEAIENKKTVVTVNAAGDERFQNAQSVTGNVLRSILCIPLLLQGQVLGVLYADNRIAMGVFDNSIVPVITAFGVQAATAIANARQFGQVKDDLEEAQERLQKMEIIIDQNKLEDQLSDLTESAYFKSLEDIKRQSRK